MRIWHPFHSTKGDGPNSNLVRPVDWNADHKFETTADGVVLGRLAGAGAGAVQEIPFRAMGIFDEVVLTAPAAEMKVTVPGSAKNIELHFLTNNTANANDTLKLNAMNGSVILSSATHQVQFLYGLGTAAGASFVNADNGWQLGNTIAATKGIARPAWIAPMSNQVLGVANLWAINATGSRYSIQTSFDGGPMVEPTGYRLASVGGTTFQVGSYLRSYVAL